MDRESHGVYEFGDFRLDVARRTLTRSSGGLVELKPKLFDVLRYLVEHAGELVEKKELLAAVWPGVIVEENNLNKSVSVIRRALGDDPDAQGYIATIPGRGYQFVHDVARNVARSPRAQEETPNEAPRAAPPPPTSTKNRWLLTVGLGITALVTLIALLWQDALRSSDREMTTHALLDVRPAQRLYGSQGSQRPSRTAIRLSPDGRTIVFTAFRDGVPLLFKRRLEDSQATEITGTEGARSPFFSPDGAWLGFWQADRFKRVPLAGGPAVDIGTAHEADVGPMGASWGTDGRIFFGTPAMNGIWSIPENGGALERVTQPGPNVHHRLAHVLPGGRAIMVTATGLRGDAHARVLLHELDTGQERVLLDDAADARYLAPGYLLFMRRGTLMAARFDLDRLEVTGTPVAVVDDVMQAINQLNSLDETFAGQFDAANGTLVFVPGGTHPVSRDQLVWVTREGTETPFALESGPLYGPRWSSDGRLVAYFTANTAAGLGDIWVYDVIRETSRRVTFDGGEWPLWSVDNTQLIFRGHGVGLRAIGLDDGPPPAEILRASGSNPAPSSFVGSTLVAVVGGQIWWRQMDGPTDWKSLPAHGGTGLEAPALSPDGRWLAYVSRETGKSDVYVRRFPEGGETVRVSMTDPASPRAGASSPRWTRGGSELVFMREKDRDLVEIVAVTVDMSDGFNFSSPRVLFEGNYQQTVPVHSYDVSADGQRFIMAKRGGGEPFVTTMELVLNWDSELERLLPTR